MKAYTKASDSEGDLPCDMKSPQEQDKCYPSYLIKRLSSVAAIRNMYKPQAASRGHFLGSGTKVAQMPFVPLQNIEYGACGDLVIVFSKPYSLSLRGTTGSKGLVWRDTWVVVKNLVRFWISIAIRSLILRVPKKGP